MPKVEMKKLYLLAHQEEREKILGLLQRLGTVELVNAQSSPEWIDMKSLMEPDQPTAQENRLEAQLGEVHYSLDFLQRYYPEKKNFIQSFAGSKIDLSIDEFNDLISRRQTVAAVYKGCREAEERLAQIRNEEVRCRGTLGELAPWSALDVPLEEIRSSQRTKMGLVTVPVEKLEGLQETLADKIKDYYLKVISGDKEQVFCFLVYLLEDLALMQDICKSAEAGEVSFPGLKGTPAEVIAEVNGRFQLLAEEKATVKSEAEKLLVHRSLLMAHYDYLQNELDKQEAVVNLARTEDAFYLEGWVPDPALNGLKTILEKETETAVVMTREAGPDEDPPVLLHNKGLADAHEAVTKLYGAPSNKDLDPTPLMTPFFFACFGICLSDVCYGALLSLLAFVLSRKLKLAGMGKQLINLLFWGGISAIIFGVLMGGWFGDLIHIPPLWFNPINDPMQMLIFSFAIGVVQIYFGMGIQAYQNIKNGRVWDALFDQGGWYLFLSGLMLLFLPAASQIGKWVAIAGAVILILTQGRSQEKPIRKLLSGMISLYDVTGFLSDVLSYSRLLALGLATGVIASAINTMGTLLAGSIVGIVIMIVLLTGGHIFNLVISSLSAYVHTSRLQYIEFFGKFFEGGGKVFRPFQINTKFVDVEEREAC